jgi:hypothetical protein
MQTPREYDHNKAEPIYLAMSEIKPRLPRGPILTTRGPRKSPHSKRGGAASLLQSIEMKRANQILVRKLGDILQHSQNNQIE